MASLKYTIDTEITDDSDEKEDQPHRLALEFTFMKVDGQVARTSLKFDAT